MNYRHAEILASEDLGVSGTKIIDINVQDPISRITLIHQPVGGSVTILGHPVSNITKLELIDGSEVLYSLTGKMGQANNIFNRKHPIVMETDYRVGGTPLIYIDIEFGRFLWDQMLAFDPKKFKNPQLKLTWNEAAYDASVGSHAFIIFGHIFDQKSISPVGFLSAREIKSFTGVAGSYDYTDLPLDYTIRKLLLQGELAGSGVRAVIEDIRISEDNDKRVPIDGDIHELRGFLDEMSGDCVENIRATVATSSTTLYCLAHNLASVVQSVDTPDVVPSSGACSGGRFWSEMETAAGNVQFTLRGQNPHGCIGIPFGNQQDMEDWYDVSAIGSLKLRLHGGSGAASSTTRIAVEQLRRY
ncbi:MAG: hypothetical protein WAV28_18785 [Sedimentisphaerales bacterium]